MKLGELNSMFPEQARAVVPPPAPPSSFHHPTAMDHFKKGRQITCFPHVVYAENELTGLQERMMMDEWGDLWPIDGYNSRFASLED
jgi:hypothetical protein